MPRRRCSAFWGPEPRKGARVLSDPAHVSERRMNKRIGIAIGAVVIALLAASVWLWATAGRETTDDAQVDAHVAPVAARVGGTVTEVAVKDNQQVDAGAVLVVI